MTTSLQILSESEKQWGKVISECDVAVEDRPSAAQSSAAGSTQVENNLQPVAANRFWAGVSKKQSCVNMRDSQVLVRKFVIQFAVWRTRRTVNPIPSIAVRMPEADEFSDL